MKKLSLFSLLFVHALVAQAIEVGTSSTRYATAFNNARKIVRTAAQRRIVVYEDSLADKAVVRLAFSDDGKNWQPKSHLVLGDGHSPAIAVSDNDTLYIAYTKWNESVIKLVMLPADDLPDLANVHDLDIYFGNPGAQHGYPTLDVGLKFLHLAFQSYNIAASTSTIRYGLFHRNLEPATSIFTVSALNATATRPTLQTDLEFGSDYVNLFWNEDQEFLRGIHHLSLNARQLFLNNPQSESEFWEQLQAEIAFVNTIFPQLGGCEHPSASIRTAEWGSSGDYVFLNRIILGCDNPTKQQFQLFSIDYETNSSSIDFRSGYTYNSDIMTWPSVDDVILDPRSCAILWESDGTILYGQSEYADIVTDPPIEISEIGSSHYPSVCYKTFRADSFDVVWTQGDSAPYKIMYCRLAKKYWFDHLTILTTSLKQGIYRDPDGYEQVIEMSGGLNKPVLEIIKGRLPDRLRLEEKWLTTGKWYITGEAIESGDFPITLRARDLGHDTGMLFDSVDLHLVIKNSAPVIDADTTIASLTGQSISYRFSITDPEDNPIEWHVQNLPTWLRQNGFSITGTAPDEPHESEFIIAATDFDKRASLVVKVKIFTAINNKAETYPSRLTLLPLYPNPFNPATTIKIGVPKRDRVCVQVYDVAGRSVDVLHDGIWESGWHEISFDATNLTSGTYFVRLNTDDEIQIQKCLLLK
ncbi:T9SS type A sorting domain-containing protein [candidate division KSB1 bacterium]|nr:T9SS type A sorting domain-containing protein [candidate division KSB1 bacterium]